jgi:hypothetical protein
MAYTKIDAKYTELSNGLCSIYKDTNMGFIPLDDKEACELMGLVEVMYMNYTTDPALYADVTEELYKDVQISIEEFAKTRGVVLQLSSQSSYASASY